MPWSEIYWLAWLGLVFGTSLPVIVYNRLRRRPWRNLIETMWRWTDNNPAVFSLRPFRFPWPLVPLTLFMWWLTVHLVFGRL